MPRRSSSLSKQYNQLKRETLRELRKIQRYLGRDRFIKSFAFRYAKELKIITPKSVKPVNIPSDNEIIKQAKLYRRKLKKGRAFATQKTSTAVENKLRRQYFKKYKDKPGKPLSVRSPKREFIIMGRRRSQNRIVRKKAMRHEIDLWGDKADILTRRWYDNRTDNDDRNDDWYKDQISRIKVYRQTEGTTLRQVKLLEDSVKRIGNDEGRRFTDDEIDSRRNDFLDRYIEVPGSQMVLGGTLDSTQLQQLQQYSRAHGRTKEERNEIFYQLKRRLEEYSEAEYEKAREVFDEYYDDNKIIEAEWSYKK